MVFLSVDRFETLVPTGNELALSILPQEPAESNRKAANGRRPICRFLRRYE
jgi:hypothetical protein